jgi:hypothetical protein
MADTKVMLHCHGCKTWAPTTASDGQRKRCPNCKMNIQVIRYPELHPKSAIGQNVKPLTEPVPGSSLAVRPAPASPAVRTGRQVIPGSVIASDVGHPLVSQRERKPVTVRRTDTNPLRGLTPPDASNRPCEFCTDLAIRIKGVFPVATHEVRTAVHSETKLACLYHVKELHTLHFITVAKPIVSMPNPVPGYRIPGINEEG